MARKKNRSRKPSRRQAQRPEEVKHMGNSLEIFGLEDPFKEVDSDKRRGPPVAQAVRTHGDPEYSTMMAEALAHSGHVERATHSFHTYPAAMHPNMAKQIIDLHSDH